MMGGRGRVGKGIVRITQAGTEVGIMECGSPALATLHHQYLGLQLLLRTLVDSHPGRVLSIRVPTSS